jgi:hypothetical protein
VKDWGGSIGKVGPGGGGRRKSEYLFDRISAMNRIRSHYPVDPLRNPDKPCVVLSRAPGEETAQSAECAEILQQTEATAISTSAFSVSSVVRYRPLFFDNAYPQAGVVDRGRVFVDVDRLLPPQRRAASLRRGRFADLTRAGSIDVLAENMTRRP